MKNDVEVINYKKRLINIYNISSYQKCIVKFVELPVGIAINEKIRLLLVCIVISVILGTIHGNLLRPSLLSLTT